MEECSDLMANATAEVGLTFSKHSIVSCEKQLVNGINHRLRLSNADHPVKDCEMVIWHDFQKTTYEALKGRQGENDCFTKLKLVQGKTEEEEEV